MCRSFPLVELLELSHHSMRKVIDAEERSVWFSLQGFSFENHKSSCFSSDIVFSKDCFFLRRSQKHLRNFKLAYSEDDVLPKHHFTQHLGPLLRSQGYLPSCFTHERRHKFVKLYGNASRNVNAPECGSIYSFFFGLLSFKCFFVFAFFVQRYK